MSDKEIEIVWKRKINYNSGTYRIAIPIEIAEAFNVKKGETVHITLEGRKMIVEFPE
jgi:bifunctional DNA-binding transcriptional regulator/antitoxin component of YhaV-PrlF toxin-antitoxin module